MKSKKIIIEDYELFYDTISNIVKLSNSAKIVFYKNNFKVSVKNTVSRSRIDIESSSAHSEKEDITICTQTLNIFSQILYKIIKNHKNKQNNVDYSDVELTIINDTTVCIKCNTFKTNFGLVKESAIEVLGQHNFHWNVITEINVDIDDIKDMLSSVFMFREQNGLMIKLSHQDDMVKNILYGEIYDPVDPVSNKYVSKFGNIMIGDLTKEICVTIPNLHILTIMPIKSLIIKFTPDSNYFTDFKITSSTMSNVYTHYTITSYYFSYKSMVNKNVK